MNGRAYVAKEVEPYSQFWLSARERLLFAMFARRGGMERTAAIDAAMRVAAPCDHDYEERALARAVAGMCEVGVLLREGDDTSRYQAKMAADYLRHRPFPRAIAEHIISRAPVSQASHVLDLAGGPGSLALELARATDNVAMIELSKGFVAAARKAAKARGVKLDVIHDSANRLVYRDGAFNVITVSQALHWLDDVQVVKGVCRLLREGGSFFVIHGALTLGDDHPLSYVLGDKTPLGDKRRIAFEHEVVPLLQRVALLFDALDAPDVARHDPTHARGGSGRIVPVATTLFRQRRPISEGFARAFLAPDHIAATGQKQTAFWADLSQRCAAATPEASLGTQEWAVLQFKRGAVRNDQIEAGMVEIAWDAAV